MTYNHKGIRRSLGRLRTLVIGHYSDVNKFAKGLEMKVNAHEMRLKRLEEAAGLDHVG